MIEQPVGWARVPRAVRAFVDAGPFSRERAERLLGLRFGSPDRALTSPLVFGLAATDRSIVEPVCAGTPTELRTAFTHYYSGDPIELAVAYMRSDAVAHPYAVLHRELGPPWSCSVGVLPAGPHSYVQVPVYVWRGRDATVTVQKENVDRCAMLRVSLHPAAWQPPEPLRSLSCEELPGFRAGPR